MLFNSFAFAVFFPIVFTVYWAVHRNDRARFAVLLGSSYVFYAFWSVHYLGLILFSTVLDYAVGRGLGATDSPRWRRVLLGCSLAGNLGVLATFKYWDFFAAEAARALGALGWQVEPALLGWVLPVGISFYTFQTLSYTIDVYRGDLDVERDFVRFALFVSFFPQLVAGPIVRAREFLPQLRVPARVTQAEFESGLALVFWGLTKKVLIADFLGRTLVDVHYATPHVFGGWYALISMYAYAFQIYGDFSGYSDVAIGLGRMLGFRLPLNFDSPYKSTTWREFWRRWHITFSTWFRDYLFLPLGGSRGSTLVVCRSLLVTMTLVGLWHGAGWTFIVFGLSHGLLIGAEIFLGVGQPASKVAFFLKWVLTFHGCVFTMILFRAPDLETAWAVFSSLWNRTPQWPLSFWTLFAISFAALTHFLRDDAKAFLRRSFQGLPPEARGASYACVLGILMNASTLKAPFIYFQF